MCSCQWVDAKPSVKMSPFQKPLKQDGENTLVHTRFYTSSLCKRTKRVNHASFK